MIAPRGPRRRERRREEPEGPPPLLEQLILRTRRRAKILAASLETISSDARILRSEIAALRAAIVEARHSLDAPEAPGPGAPSRAGGVVARVGAPTARALAAARARLREGAASGDGLAALREVVVDLVGCEEMLVYRVERREGSIALTPVLQLTPAPEGSPARSLAPALALGPGAAARALEAPLGGPLAAALLAGKARLACDAAPAALPAAGGAGPSAWVPLLGGGGALAGAVALLGLLSHRPPLCESDRPLLDLLALEGGAALAACAG